jgi:N-acetylglucosamine-6-phosphate deacetylase
VELVRRAANPRLCVVSDAIAAAALGDGRYRLGELEVEVRDGRSTRADGTLAGSVGPLDAAVRRLVDGGAPLGDAVHAATRAPALLAGRPDLGTLEPGATADVVVLDSSLHVTRTLVGGVEHAG